MHENLYESNRNYGELCTKTYIKAIETMMNRTKTYMEAMKLWWIYESNRR